jgi:ROS/MUCR transcriptional regulator protein
MVTYGRDAYLEEAWKIVTDDLVYLPIRGRPGSRVLVERSPSGPNLSLPPRCAAQSTMTTSVCLVCGEQHRTLRRHLDVAHRLTPETYREQFGLKSDYPMAAPGYSRQRAEMAKRVGLGQRR